MKTDTWTEILGVICVAIGAVVLIAAILTIPTWFLWNATLPDLFGFKRLTLLQAAGIQLLASFLFRTSASQGKSK